MSNANNQDQEFAKKVIIFGAGPAGLTAAYELLSAQNIQPVVFEMNNKVGGLSRTIEYKGNKIDIGPHRYFSKKEKILKWWLQILPLLENSTQSCSSSEDCTSQERFLLRKRTSRIFFNSKFIDYPLKIRISNLKAIGVLKAVKIINSYLQERLHLPKKIVSLEDLLVARFGQELYKTFFYKYSKKVWGVSPSLISSAWAEKRIQSLSMKEIIIHALNTTFRSQDKNLRQGHVPTSLIEKLL